MNEITQFETPCHYRSGAMYCSSGFLYVMEPEGDMATLAILDRNLPVKCPACHGVGYILLPAGKQLIEMLRRHQNVDVEAEM